MLNNQHLWYVISEGGIASQNFQSGSFLLRIYSSYVYMYKTKDLGTCRSDNTQSQDPMQCTIHLFTVDHLPCPMFTCTSCHLWYSISICVYGSVKVWTCNDCLLYSVVIIVEDSLICRMKQTRMVGSGWSASRKALPLGVGKTL